MPRIESLIKELKNNEFEKAFGWLYGPKSKEQPERYIEALERFREVFSDGEVTLFSAPGRTEVGGNHTDHQHGCVLAAAVNLDVIAVVAKSEDSVIRLQSKGYPMDVVDLSDLSIQEEEKDRSQALIRGVCARFRELGYQIGGFHAYTTSNVLKGSGLSSSAAFEILVCTILNGLYNNGKMDDVEAAIVSQYAENTYFGKPCGLMDQTACSVGGFVGIDFNDPKAPVIEKVDFDFAAVGHSLCIVDTGGNHADLTDEYTAIPADMKAVAAFFGKPVLRDTDEAEFYHSFKAVREQCGDKAVLRAVLFFDDNRRAVLEKEMLHKGDFKGFLQLIKESGLSSQNKLQNIFATIAPGEQGLNVALALSERLLQGRGAYRVHGGGFAGTIQAFVPDDLLEHYQSNMEAVFGEGTCYVLSIRPIGGTKIEKGMK